MGLTVDPEVSMAHPRIRQACRSSGSLGNGVSDGYLPVPVNRRAAGSKLDFPVDRSGVEVEILTLIATAGRERHDAALQLLVCLGQIVRERLSPNELRAYWQLLDSEFQTGSKANRRGGTHSEEDAPAQPITVSGTMSTSSAAPSTCRPRNCSGAGNYHHTGFYQIAATHRSR